MTASKQFRYHTVSKRILGDLLTPVSVYMKMRDLSPQSALMESSIIMVARIPSRSSLLIPLHQ